jgi:HPt (histidine-containing phosphotransfer) domain-containing protein
VVAGARELYLGSGMDDFLCKPIEAEELNRALGKWLPKDMITVKAVRETALDAARDTGFVPVDRAAGIMNAANDETLYKSLLADFRFGHNKDLEKITAALEALNYQLAQRLVHTLKSTANLIGAKVLGGAALAVEKALKENNGVPARDLWGTQETLEREFDAVMAELEQIVPKSAERTYEKGDLDAAGALAFIRKLEPLLQSGSSGSLSLRDDIREILGPVGEECGKLIALIENLDFREAAETLNQIQEKIINLRTGPLT